MYAASGQVTAGVKNTLFGSEFAQVVYWSSVSDSARVPVETLTLCILVWRFLGI